MNCKEVQDLILTDYIDGELDMEAFREVNRHIETCKACRVMTEAVIQTVVTPFKDLERVTPPEPVWHHIKDEISRDHRKGLFRYVSEKLSPIFLLQRPIFAVPAIAIALVVIVFITMSPDNHHGVVNHYLNEQIEFLAGMDQYEENYYMGIDIWINDEVNGYTM